MNDILKSLTSLKSLATIISSVVVIFGAGFAIDSRYVHADELNTFKTENAKAIQQLSRESKQQVNTLRKQMLEDKVFDLTAIPPNKRSDIDRAKLNKYQTDLDVINREMDHINTR